MSIRRCYRGAYPCPRCKGRETGTHTVATTTRWIDFACDTCGLRFRKAAAGVSALSRTLRKAGRLP